MNHPSASPETIRQQPRRRVPPWAWTLLKFVVSAGLITWLAVRFDWVSTWQTLRTVHWLLVVTGILLMILAQLLGAYRLKRLLAVQHVDIGYWYCVRVTFVGLFASNFLPSTVGGDVIKIALLARDGSGATLSTASILTDRLFNVLAVLLLLPTIFVLRDLLDPQTVRLVEYGAAGLVLVAVVLIGTLYCLRRPLKDWLSASGKANGLRARINSGVSTLLQIFTLWARSPGVLLLSLVLSWGAVFSSISGSWLVARYLGIPVSFIEMTATVILIYFITLIPVSLNGLGLQEVSLLYLLTGIGASTEQALAVAVVARLSYVVPSLLGVVGISQQRIAGPDNK